MCIEIVYKGCREIDTCCKKRGKGNLVTRTIAKHCRDEKAEKREGLRFCLNRSGDIYHTGILISLIVCYRSCLISLHIHFSRGYAVRVREGIGWLKSEENIMKADL